MQSGIRSDADRRSRVVLWLGLALFGVWLAVALPAALQDGSMMDVETETPNAIPDAEQVKSHLEAAGLRPVSWSFRVRLTQAAYRDWLKIPVLTNRLLPGLRPQERAFGF